jgi:hypothetical protein
MASLRIGIDRKILAVAAVSVLALASAGVALAQNTDEAGLRGRDKAAADKVKALVEADRKHPRLGGIWVIGAPVDVIKTVDGKVPAMTPAGKKLYKERIAERKAGNTKNDPLEYCLPPGTPRSLWSGEPIMIAQAPAKVTFYHQYRHLIRHVFLDGPPKLDEPDPNWEGHSSGWWDGDALKIQTIGFNGEQWVDTAGLPQSPDQKVDETLKLLDANTLEDTVTVTDPKFYTAPWTTKVTFKRLPDTTFMPEEECSEKLLEFPLKPYAPSDGGTGHGARGGN